MTLGLWGLGSPERGQGVEEEEQEEEMDKGLGREMGLKGEEGVEGEEEEGVVIALF